MRQRFQHIASLDEHILSDELLVLLQRSPQTSNFIEHRITQIVTEIMSIPIIAELQEQIEQLQNILQEVELQKNAATMSHSKESTKNQNILQKYARKNKELEKQIAILGEVKEERDNYRIHIQQLQHKYRETSEAENKLKQEIQKKDREFEQKDKECIKIMQQLRAFERDNKQKQSKLRGLEDELQKIKKLCKQTKYHQIRYKKEGHRMQQEYQIVIQQLSKLKDELSVEKAHRENERKALSTKITQLYKKTKNGEKALKKILIINQQNKKLKSQVQKLRQQIKKQMQALHQYTKIQSYKIMDEIGEQVNNELKVLLTQISKNAAEVRICRQEIKIKDEIIQKLEKVSSVQVMGNRELQKELKSKKIQADSLRKQLKKNYEESQVKFMGLENSYRQILANTANLYMR